MLYHRSPKNPNFRIIPKPPYQQLPIPCHGGHSGRTNNGSQDKIFEKCKKSLILLPLTQKN